MAVLPLALTIDRFTNGLTRPFFGWISDRLVRENTMVLAFGLEGIAMALWLLTRDNTLVFDGDAGVPCVEADAAEILAGEGVRRQCPMQRYRITRCAV